ncbi:MAG: hypothetical protein M3444_13085 [Acidobacteriota bacterium]|nr:hypothetical protein [Acidobacteriota bacterium]MDQ5835424.1 hypothetical protein [Acidobacteriota bacterium]
MLRRFASALLVLLLLGAAVAGAATRRRGHECRMPAGHDCCKRARSDGHLQNDGHIQNDVAPPPCCLVNSPQPAPAGTNFTLRPPSDAGPAPQPPAAQTPCLHASKRARAYAQPFQPSHSPPAYIQHLALLI